MNFNSEFINTQGKVEAIVDGQILFSNYLKLDMCAISAAGYEPNDIQLKRGDIIPVDNKNANQRMANEQKQIELLGEKYVSRQKTKVVSKGTVYGVPQIFKCGFTHQSISGINKHFLDDDGVPSFAAITKQLRTLANNVDLKEQRLNRMFDSYITRDFYDNSTALIFNFLIKIQVAEMTSLMNTHDGEFIFRAEDIEKYAMIPDMDMRHAVLLQDLQLHSEGFGCTTEDIEIYRLAEHMTVLKNSLPQKNLDGQTGEKSLNFLYTKWTYAYKYKYWAMYEYDDGHSKSGNKFGNPFGFVNNKFKVPTSMWDYPGEDCENMIYSEGGFPLNEKAIDMFGANFGFIHCSGLNQQELCALSYVLRGNKRATPLLIDQDLDFQIPDGKQVVALYTDEPLNIPDIKVTRDLLISTLTKLLYNNKWYGDLDDAVKALRYWTAQPSTETVESHWWLGIERKLVLPYLGLRRAVLSLFVTGDGVEVTSDAVNVARDLLSKNHSAMFSSVFANACWYWGEYMLRHNGEDSNIIAGKVHGDREDTLASYERSDAIFSAMIGKAVPRATGKWQGTHIIGGLQHYYKKKMPFGVLSIPGIEENGYTINNNNLITNALVVPGCTGMVVGLGGSLINGTPYGSIFNINQAVTRTIDRRPKLAYNYNDLWAYGVVNRWQGYNVKYKHPNANTRHTIYAANDVSVAMPPVTLKTMSEISSYILMGTTQREHCFGSTLETARHCKMTFCWTRNVINPHVTLDYHSETIMPDNRSDMIAAKFSTTLTRRRDDIALIMANYDHIQQDFQISYPKVAVPLPTSTDVLTLADTDTGIPVTQNEPPDTSPGTE